MSTRKFGTYATREEFLENEVRTLSFHIQSMIDMMKVMSMNRQDLLEELERMKLELKTAATAAAAEKEKQIIDILERLQERNESHNYYKYAINVIKGEV